MSLDEAVHFLYGIGSTWPPRPSGMARAIMRGSESPVEVALEIIRLAEWEGRDYSRRYRGVRKTVLGPLAACNCRELQRRAVQQVCDVCQGPGGPDGYTEQP